MNAHVGITVNEPAAPIFPIVYAMSLNLNGATVEGYEHGDLVLFNTLEEPEAGDLVCVHPKRSGAVMLVLTMGLGPTTFDRMPWVSAPGDDVVPLVVGTIMGTDRQVAFKATDVWAVHKCDGKADPDVCEEDA